MHTLAPERSLGARRQLWQCPMRQPREAKVESFEPLLRSAKTAWIRRMWSGFGTFSLSLPTPKRLASLQRRPDSKAFYSSFLAQSRGSAAPIAARFGATAPIISTGDWLPKITAGRTEVEGTAELSGRLFFVSSPSIVEIISLLKRSLSLSDRERPLWTSEFRKNDRRFGKPKYETPARRTGS
jgi:hypothetical protein